MSGNRKFTALVLSLGLGVSTAAWAQTATAPAGSTGAAPTKVAIVQIQEAIAATKDGQKELGALQARFTPKQNELKALNDEVEKLKKDLEAQGSKLSEEERASRIKTLETKQKTLQRNYEDYQNEAQQAQQEMLNRLGGKMMTVLDTYAKANGYAVVLDVSNPQTPVLYASEATNITKHVVDAYNAQSPAAPAAKPAGSGAAANKPAGTTAPPKP
ncbi:MAG TPA: OmpH family outer membrane protein [Candidatus Angelobacter sp.]|nr:OmpH family outer membrane protein [Candidatus Angelobacter sp.]